MLIGIIITHLEFSIFIIKIISHSSSAMMIIDK